MQDPASDDDKCIQKTVRPNKSLFSTEDKDAEEDDDLFESAGKAEGSVGASSGDISGSEVTETHTPRGEAGEEVEKVVVDDGLQEHRRIPHPGDPTADEVHAHKAAGHVQYRSCLLYTSPSPRDRG